MEGQVMAVEGQGKAVEGQEKAVEVNEGNGTLNESCKATEPHLKLWMQMLLAVRGRQLQSNRPGPRVAVRAEPGENRLRLPEPLAERLRRDRTRVSSQLQ